VPQSGQVFLRGRAGRDDEVVTGLLRRGLPRVVQEVGRPAGRGTYGGHPEYLWGYRNREEVRAGRDDEFITCLLRRDFLSFDFLVDTPVIIVITVLKRLVCAAVCKFHGLECADHGLADMRAQIRCT